MRAQLLDSSPPAGLLGVVRHLTLLQVDPTAVLAPNAGLVAWSRLGSSYAPAQLGAALEDRALVELRAMIRPAEDLALYRADMARWERAERGDLPGWRASYRDWVRANDACRRDILGRLACSGPLPSRDLPGTCTVPWKSSGWTNNRNVTQLLEFMVLRGEVAVAGRSGGGDRLWDLAERVYPDDPVVPAGQALRIRNERRLRALGIARARGPECPVEPADVGEAGLAKIAEACARARRPLRGQDKIAVRADRVLARRKVAKHFTVEITDDSLRYARDQDSIAAEAKLDGIYVLRTSVQASDLDSPQVVASYKALAQVERAFRAFSTDLDIRPIRHRTEDRVRAHVFLRMLSYYLSWHIQARLAPLLFTDDDKPAASAARTSPVAPAARSPRAQAKAATKHTPGDLPVHSFATLLADLGTICLNTIAPADPALPGFRLVTTPTALQRQALELLGVSHRLGIA